MPNIPIAEQNSLLDRAKSTVLNTSSNKQRDSLEQRLPGEQHKAEIIIATAQFFWVGLDLSYLETRPSKEELVKKVKGALDQVDNNMDDSNNMNQVSGLNLFE